MATPVVMPRQGQSVESCVILEWLSKKGDKVKEGDVLFTYETDKAGFEFESPATGTLLEIFFPEGEDVPVLTNVAVIGNDGENIDEYRPDTGGKQTSAVVVEDKKSPVSNAPAGKTPVSSQQGGVQGFADFPPVFSGKASPRAKRAAGNKGICLSSVAGSGPDGRVIERDISAASLNVSTLTSTATAMQDKGYNHAVQTGTGIGGRICSRDMTDSPAQGVEGFASGEYTEIALTKIRTLIGQRMMSSLLQSAQLTMNASANASGLMSLRKKIKENGAKAGLENITINDMVAWVLARALTAFPEINAIFTGSSIRQFKNIHLAVAVDTPRGLMVPVVGSADTLSLNELAGKIKEVASQCINGSINPDLLAGGTITLSNLGMYGIESFTPVLNPPQVALLGVNTIVDRPDRGDNGQINIVPFIGFSLTIDHRAIDGAPGAKFLKAFVEKIENIEHTPEIMEFVKCMI